MNDTYIFEDRRGLTTAVDSSVTVGTVTRDVLAQETSPAVTLQACIPDASGPKFRPNVSAVSSIFRRDRRVIDTSGNGLNTHD